jgi:hypothetical protein
MDESRRSPTFSGRRTAAGLAFAVACLLTLAPASFEASAPAATALRFGKLPGRALAGQAVTVAVERARPGARCSLAVSYGRSAQTGIAPAIAANGGASWTWTIPQTVQANRAKLTVACSGSKRITAGLLVVGSLVPPRMSVEKDGFSVRTSTTGSSDASYGVIIRNHSPNADAENVSVLVNFVLANDHLLGSTSSTISSIPANSSYALGGSLGFPGAAPIARLEVVIHVGATNRHTGHPPALDNIVVEPSPYEQSWVGDVAGEVINNDPHQMLQSTSYSAVVLDAAGNILGGGSGQTYGPSLPPGTREVFKLTSGGFKDIPVQPGLTAIVSATPTWQPASPSA